MKKRLLLKIALWTGATVLVLFTVLVIHIYQVTHKPKTDARERQLSRIDFQELKAEDAGKIQAFVANLDGVEDTHFNTEAGILIYTYTTGKQTSSEVYDQLMKSGNYKATKYTVDNSAAQTGCPAMGDDHSLRAKLVTFIANL